MAEGVHLSGFVNCKTEIQSSKVKIILKVFGNDPADYLDNNFPMLLNTDFALSDNLSFIVTFLVIGLI